jgi:hypothetical protein
MDDIHLTQARFSVSLLVADAALTNLEVLVRGLPRRQQ